MNPTQTSDAQIPVPAAPVVDECENRAVSIRLAAPDDFLKASHGEVKKPETINYRTFRPEKDGLFCERIFGPERDYECHCGKYRGQKHMGIVCDKCGVMVTTSRERRKRMGHIKLAAPCAHIWFFSVTPSRMGNLLAMKKTELERVVYFQDYVVLDPGESDKKKGFFDRLGSVFSTAKVVQLSRKRFEEFSGQLNKRCDFVGSGLGSLGLRTQRLSTQALIELYYNSYNPDLFQRQPLEDVNKLRIET